MSKNPEYSIRTERVLKRLCLCLVLTSFNIGTNKKSIVVIKSPSFPKVLENERKSKE